MTSFLKRQTDITINNSLTNKTLYLVTYAPEIENERKCCSPKGERFIFGRIISSDFNLGHKKQRVYDHQFIKIREL